MGEKSRQFCEICGRETPRYKNGACMSCVSRDAHGTAWCDQCQKQTSHLKNICKQHNFKLIKNGNKIELWNMNHKILDDISILDDVTIRTTPRSVMYDLPKGAIHIKCNNEFVDLNTLLYNENVSDWVKVTYRYDGRKDHTRYMILTTDHPLPLLDGRLVTAGNLKIKDKLIRVDVKSSGSGLQWTYAEVVNVEPYTQTCRSYDVSTETEYFDVNNDILSHNCRSFLTPWTTEEDKSNSLTKYNSKYYGRFNAGVVTINLVDAGLAAEKNLDSFWNILDERLELCHKALKIRHERLSHTISDTSPIHWQYGALARLEKGQSIHELLHNGYSTLSLGYAGLWECVYALIGKKLTEPEGEKLGLDIMQRLNDKCAEWKITDLEGETEILSDSDFNLD